MEQSIDRHHQNFAQAMHHARHDLRLFGEDVDAGRWQGYATEGRPDLITRELIDYKIHVPVDRRDGMKDLVAQLALETGCNREWADEHFAERVGGEPMNPDPSYERWPWWRGQESSKQAGEQFTHTYSERFWPHYLGADEDGVMIWKRRQGVRYNYGDLNDVVNQLVREPTGRQATFPIFFPEDTGAVHQGRVPCTLHYHFLMRDNRLHMWYPIRSCDFVRHMADDLYLACRLLLWVIEACNQRQLEVLNRPGPAESFSWARVRPGILHWTAYSLHYHKGDEHHVR